MTSFLLTQSEYFLRILAASLCGLLIGYERENRQKAAGICTHMIVAPDSTKLGSHAHYFCCTNSCCTVNLNG